MNITTHIHKIDTIRDSRENRNNTRVGGWNFQSKERQVGKKSRAIDDLSNIIKIDFIAIYQALHPNSSLFSNIRGISQILITERMNFIHHKVCREMK